MCLGLSPVELHPSGPSWPGLKGPWLVAIRALVWHCFGLLEAIPVELDDEWG